MCVMAQTTISTKIQEQILQHRFPDILMSMNLLQKQLSSFLINRNSSRRHQAQERGRSTTEDTEVTEVLVRSLCIIPIAPNDTRQKRFLSPSWFLSLN